MYVFVVCFHVVEECFLIAEVPIVFQMIVHPEIFGIHFLVSVYFLDADKELLRTITKHLSSVLTIGLLHELTQQC